jgi:O-methyltransferase
LKLHRFRLVPDSLYLNLVYMRSLSEWINKHKKEIPNDFPSKWDYNKRYVFYENVLKNENVGTLALDYFEFGVANGHSFKWFLQKNTCAESTFNGFDTFSGLPEDFGMYKKGTFNTNNKIPEIDDPRGSFHQGLFQKTLPQFLKTYKNENRKIIMLDADLYSATVFVLASLAPFLREQDLVFFDEFTVPTQEYKAFCDFQKAFPHIHMEAVAGANNFYFTAFRISKIDI